VSLRAPWIWTAKQIQIILYIGAEGGVVDADEAKRGHVVLRHSRSLFAKVTLTCKLIPCNCLFQLSSSWTPLILVFCRPRKNRLWNKQARLKRHHLRNRSPFQLRKRSVKTEKLSKRMFQWTKKKHLASQVHLIQTSWRWSLTATGKGLKKNLKLTKFHRSQTLKACHQSQTRIESKSLCPKSTLLAEFESFGQL